VNNELVQNGCGLEDRNIVPVRVDYSWNATTEVDERKTISRVITNF